MVVFFSFDTQYIIKYLLTETEGNSMFCGPETVDVSRGEAEAKWPFFILSVKCRLYRKHDNILFCGQRESHVSLHAFYISEECHKLRTPY